MSEERAQALIVDIDGTLVDSNFHHTVAWQRAFARAGYDEIESWKIHRAIGMGGDRLVAAVAGDEIEERSGDEIRDAESEIYGEMIDEIRPLPGASELIAELDEAGIEVVLASSAKAGEAEHYVDLLGVRELCEWTSSGDVEESKPAPDLVEAALEKANRRPALMLGDTPWDCEAAAKAGIASAGVLMGGFPKELLIEAGAKRVYDSLERIREDLVGLLRLAS